MMGRIKEAEHHQIVGDLQRKVAELESKHLELVTSGQLSLHEADANDASLAALSFLAREERSDGAGVSQQGALRGKEADAAALEEEIEQMRVNERVEARLLQDSSSRGRRFNGDRSALELGVVDEDEEDDDVELKAVLNSTFKEARHELENLLFPDEKARDLENQLLLATDVLSNKSSARCSFNHKTFDTPGRLPTDNLFEASAPPDKMGTVEQSIHSAHLRSAAQADVASNSSQETSRVLSRNDSNVGLDVELLLAGIGASCDAGNSRSPSVASSDTFQPIVTNIKAPS